jgi:hypothetical protein
MISAFFWRLNGEISDVFVDICLSVLPSIEDLFAVGASSVYELNH